jgi:hypothetical protein
VREPRDQRMDVDRLSPVIRALRLTTDEVQFGRVLAAICQDPDVADAFVSGVIELAVDGNPEVPRASPERIFGASTSSGWRLESLVGDSDSVRRISDAWISISRVLIAGTCWSS